MKARIGRFAFLLSLTTVWLLLVASTLAAAVGFFAATTRPTPAPPAPPAFRDRPSAHADGGSASVVRPD